MPAIRKFIRLQFQKQISLSECFSKHRSKTAEPVQQMSCAVRLILQQEPLPDSAENGSWRIEFVISLRNRFFVIIEKDYSQHKPATFTTGYASLKKKPNLIQCA